MIGFVFLIGILDTTRRSGDVVPLLAGTGGVIGTSNIQCIPKLFDTTVQQRLLSETREETGGTLYKLLLLARRQRDD